ncbi:MAG TPA: serine protease [Bacteroidia bacterium]
MAERKNYDITPSSQLFKITGHQLCVICDQDEIKNELGTGFRFLRKNWIVTAAHVVLNYDMPRQGLFAVFASPAPNRSFLKVLAVHKEIDIAILEILDEQQSVANPLFPGDDELSVSNGLVCFGYSPSKGSNITASWVNKYSKDFRERENTEIILEFVNGHIAAGSSGGPICGDGGVVVGVLINVFSNANNPGKISARATSIQNLMDVIKIDFDPLYFRTF